MCSVRIWYTVRTPRLACCGSLSVCACKSNENRFISSFLDGYIRAYKSIASFYLSAHFLHFKTDSANICAHISCFTFGNMNREKEERVFFSSFISFASFARVRLPVCFVYSKHRKIRFGSQLRGRKEISMLLFALDFHLSSFNNRIVMISTVLWCIYLHDGFFFFRCIKRPSMI